jgi:hypothetical protein
LNGCPEQTVQTVKDLFKKAQCSKGALRLYRNTPLDGFSPEQVLKGCLLKDKLQQAADTWEKNQLKEGQLKQKRYRDQQRIDLTFTVES